LKKKTVVHISTVHDYRDPRILEKECAGAARAGHEVYLVACAKVDHILNGIRVISLKSPQDRLERIFLTGFEAFRKARLIPADIYHFHDPEFFPWAMLLSRKRAKVVYDIHEDYFTSIHEKYYIPEYARTILARVACGLENRLSKLFHTVVAENYYLDRFPKSMPVLNYPVLMEGWEDATAFDPASTRLLYTGNITESRGALIHACLVDSISWVETTMVGYCRRNVFEKIANMVKNRERLHITGLDYYVPHEEIRSFYKRGNWLAGLALFPYSPHYQQKALTKFFEYMMWGLPIICTDFPKWKRLVEGSGAGICVNPSDKSAIRCALEWLSSNPNEAAKMSENGKKWIMKKFNWDSQLERLLKVYEENR